MGKVYSLGCAVAIFSAVALFGGDGRKKPSNDDTVTWSTPVTLSGNGAASPQIVMDGSGNATAAWVQSGAVCVIQQPVGGSWGAVTTLVSSGATSPCLSIDSEGNVTAAWVQSGVVRTSVLPYGGSWSASVAVSGASASSPVLATNAGGSAALAWALSEQVQGSVRSTSPLGSLGLANTLSDTSAVNPAIHVGNSGTVCSAWQTTSGGQQIVQASTQLQGGSWSAPMTVAYDADYHHAYPKVSVDPSGNASAVFYRYLLSDDGVYSNVSLAVSTLTSGDDAWTDPEVLLNGSYGMVDPSLLTAAVQHDGSGNGMVLWTQSYDGINYSTEGALNPTSGGGWELGDQLITNVTAFQPSISMNTLNQAIVAFMMFDGTYVNIMASETGTSGIHSGPEWNGSVQISTAGMNNAYPQIASVYNESTGTMHAAAVWLATDGTNVFVQSATGTKTPIQPPTGLTVTQGAIGYGVFTQYANTLSWTQSDSPSGEVNGYGIYRNGQLFTVVDGSPPVLVDSNVGQGATITYGITTIDNNFLESVVAEITYPPQSK